MDGGGFQGGGRGGFHSRGGFQGGMGGGYGGGMQQQGGRSQIFVSNVSALRITETHKYY